MKHQIRLILLSDWSIIIPRNFNKKEVILVYSVCYTVQLKLLLNLIWNDLFVGNIIKNKSLHMLIFINETAIVQLET